jgi:hypothetical protein
VRRGARARKRNDRRQNVPVCRCWHNSGTPGVLPPIRRNGRYSARYWARYSLRRADGVPPISCVIFATHSNNAGATSLISASRGA